MLSGGVSSDTVVYDGGSEQVGNAFINLSNGQVVESPAAPPTTSAPSAAARSASPAAARPSAALVFGATANSSGFTQFSTEQVLSGGVSSDTVLSAGGSEQLGAFFFTTGGSAVQEAGGTAYYTSAISGGSIQVLSGGETVSALLVGTGTNTSGFPQFSNETVSSGGTALDTVVSSGANETVLSGGVTSERWFITAVPSSSGIFFFNGSSGQSAGGTAYNVSAVSGGSIQVLSGGETVSALLIGTGTNTSGFPQFSNEVVSSGGTALDTVVSSGGIETVLSGGVTSDTVVYNGGNEQLGDFFFFNGSSGQPRRHRLQLSAVSGGSIDVLSGGETVSALIVGTGTVSGNPVNAIEVVSTGGTAPDQRVERRLACGVRGWRGRRHDYQQQRQRLRLGRRRDERHDRRQRRHAGGRIPRCRRRRDNPCGRSRRGAGRRHRRREHYRQRHPDPRYRQRRQRNLRRRAHRHGLDRGRRRRHAGDGRRRRLCRHADDQQRHAQLSSATAGGSGPILFAGDPTLQIDGTTMPASTISGFSDFSSSGDSIDLASIAYDSAGSANLDKADDQLVITENGHSDHLQLAGNFSGEYFHLGPDGSGPNPGTEITETGRCYCPGTLIRTARGESWSRRSRSAIRSARCPASCGHQVDRPALLWGPLRWAEAHPAGLLQGRRARR